MTQCLKDQDLFFLITAELSMLSETLIKRLLYKLPFMSIDKLYRKHLDIAYVYCKKRGVEITEETKQEFGL